MGLQYALEMQTKCKYSSAFQRQKDCFSKTNQMDKQPCILKEIKLIYITVFERQTKWIHSTVFQRKLNCYTVLYFNGKPNGYKVL